MLLWAIMGPTWASEKGLGWSNMTYNHVIYPWEVFRVIWGHVRTFGAMKSHFGDILGHLGAVLGHFGAPVGL